MRWSQQMHWLLEIFNFIRILTKQLYLMQISQGIANIGYWLWIASIGTDTIQANSLSSRSRETRKREWESSFKAMI